MQNEQKFLLDGKCLTGQAKNKSIIRLPRGSVATLRGKHQSFNQLSSVFFIAVFAVMVAGVLGFDGSNTFKY